MLQLQDRGQQFILKTAGAENHHLHREFVAHARYTASLVSLGLTARVRFVDEPLRLLLLDYLPEYLCDHSPAELDPAIHTQVGRALRLLHGQACYSDINYEKKFVNKCLNWLSDEHRIKPDQLARATIVLREYRTEPALLVPTRGDWQPTNWIINGAKLHVIDFGRFDFRPAASDLNRLAVQQWKASPKLKSAFFEGYGDDPRDARTWPIVALREAKGTAAWAFQVGNTAYESLGHQMSLDALELF